MIALITGVGGFTGRYLAAHLHSLGYTVVGLAHHPARAVIAGVDRIFYADLADQAALQQVITEVSPDVVVHLAAISFVAHGDAAEIYQVNVVGTRNLLEAVVCSAVPVRAVLVASSANVYGNTQEGVLNEGAQAAPANDYAVSKLASEFVARLYFNRLPIVLVRPFNYTGVGQAEHFLLPKIVNHVRKQAPIIELGNLDVARDFSDVRMVVAYYARLLECPLAIGQTINVCSGKAYTLRDVLDRVRNISHHDFEVRVNPAFVRANEVRVLQGDRSRLLGLVPNVADIPLEDTLHWMLTQPH
ncbi:MAG: GDP-mannose 4,6-dehydratase [Halothiobacillaceae bacterium]|nr:GDP-mannose 4,6-dehydratase [Halothiobacillaceae bacterium]